MIPYGKQSINRRDIAAVAETVASDWLTQGPKISEFERQIADYCGVPYAVAVGNGTEALHLAYLATGIGFGDEVITTPNTFVATSNMLLAVGAKPVFCDIRLDTYNIDESKIEALITPKTKAIVPVHFAGQPCAMDAITRIARRHKLLVIEDGCHALGALYHDRRIGSIGDITVFSFHAVKPITTGEGGMILMANKDYYDKMLLLRSHGVSKDANGFNVMTEFGYNYRITDIQAALGCSQLKRLGQFLKKRHEVVKWYAAALRNISEIVLPIEEANLYSGWHLYMIRVNNLAHRLGLYQYLRAAGIGVNLHYPAVYSHPYYRTHGFSDVHLTNADIYSATAITLPLHMSLKRADVQFVARHIRDFFNKYV